MQGLQQSLPGVVELIEQLRLLVEMPPAAALLLACLQWSDTAAHQLHVPVLHQLVLDAVRRLQDGSQI